MSFTDKNLECADCGRNFTFTVTEQEFFASKGFTNEPKRCQECRSAKKQQSGGDSRGGYGSSRMLYPAVCAQCGTHTQVPFSPRGDKPVYCSQCYSNMGARSRR